jgi:hypothetical protein
VVKISGWSTGDVKIDYYLLVVAADDHEVDGLAGVNVEFQMRHKRREVDKVSWAYFCRELEPLSPAYLAPAFDDVDRHFVAAVMMRPGVCPSCGGVRDQQAFHSTEVSLLDPFVFCSAGIGGGVLRYHRKDGPALVFRKARRPHCARRLISQLAVSKIERTLGQRAPRG